MLHSKKPPVARKFSEDMPFELHFEHNSDLTPAFFAGKTEGQSIKDAIHQCTSRARMTHQLQLHGWYRATSC